MRIWTRKSALIQPRTSLGKSDVSWPAPASVPRGPRGGAELHSQLRRQLRRQLHCQLHTVASVACEAAWIRRRGSASRCTASCTATTHHSFRGSFSAGSTPIFASKHAFFSIFRDLQENLLLASKFCKIFAKIYKICWREDDILVDLEKC